MSKFCTPSTTLAGYTAVSGGSEGNLLDALYTQGPISVAVDGTGNSFQFYTSGVYCSSQCSSKKLNHALLLAGYGTTIDGQDYWILKNSWGTTWGMSGYLKLARNQNNMCGVATAASYPMI
ncbi:Cathepsin L [Geodia barretti]|uniref:Cathepsin L n=1 Tax=Geodia barretti TaxID=519541 RepID=A0AA35SF18_GEOBA|nr:Cathepsin L [Geodia barretti]